MAARRIGHIDAGISSGDTRMMRATLSDCKVGWQPLAPLFRWLYASLVLMIGLALVSTPAHAQYATGGSGIYRNQIIWFDWGTNGASIPAGGASITNTSTVAGQTLSVTCTLSGISGSNGFPQLEIYRPGGYREDGLDDLYNIGGSETANTMDIGLITPNYGQTAQFNFSCTATLNGTPFVLSGLVFADAETTSVNENTQATLPVGATMRVIERIRAAGCTTGYNVNRTGALYTYSTIPPNSCPSGNPAPMAVNFIDGASSAQINLKGGGKQAVALGVMVNVADYGDGPASYGNAAHLPQTTWTGGEVPQGNTNIFGSGFTLASLVPPTTAMLGSRVDVENAPWYSATATGDDTNGQADEDGVAAGALAIIYRSQAGQAYSVPVACVGNAPMAGWIDFDRSGQFDADERSATVNCSGGSATLTWTIPADAVAGQSYLRIRTAVLASDIANPTGVAGSGEVEDYALTIADPQIRVAKITLGTDGGPFGFTTTNTVAQPAPVTTSAAGVAVTGAPVQITDLSASVAVVEATIPTGWGMTGLACTNAGGGAVAGVVYDGAARRATIPASALTPTSDITCTFTNANLPTLALAKTWVNAALNDTATLNSAGGTNNPTLSSTADTPNETDTGIPLKVDVGNSISLSEALGGSNVGVYDASAWSCTGGTLSGSTLTIGAGDAALAIVCTITNTRQQTDLAVVKTATPDPVRSRNLVNYTITATNNGPNGGNGAVIQDFPDTAVDCLDPAPIVDCVGSGGAICPSPTVPVSTLTGAGVTIPTFPVGGQIVLTYQCRINATGLP